MEENKAKGNNTGPARNQINDRSLRHDLLISHFATAFLRSKRLAFGSVSHHGGNYSFRNRVEYYGERG